MIFRSSKGHWFRGLIACVGDFGVVRGMRVEWGVGRGMRGAREG